MSDNLYDLQTEVLYPNRQYFQDEVRDSFFDWTMMKRFWAAQLKVLAEIDTVCKRHGLKWYADYGTLLGAVRHGGYIPWDDDFDICMFRDDYDTFMRCAQNELPKGYVVKDVKIMDGFENMIGRVNNASKISYDSDHMDRYFGCPYIVGVDIFPLDGLYKDENKEKERMQRATNIFGALVLIGKGEENTDLFNSLLTDIEKKNNLRFDKKGDLKRQLILLADRVISECPVSEADEVALMAFHVEYHTHVFSKKWYENRVLLPFEYVHLPVPAQYNRVLENVYGQYMTVVYGGGLHDYPLYMAQENLLKDKLGGNVLRYTMPEKCMKRDEPVPTLKKYAEINDMLKQVHVQLDILAKSDNSVAVRQLTKGCQTLIDSIFGFIYERGDTESLHKEIQEYKQCLEILSDQASVAGTSVEDDTSGLLRELNDRLEKVGSEVHSLINNRKKEVLFLPIKADWWYSMESEWELAIPNGENDVYVMPLLYMEKDIVQDTVEEMYDGEDLPDYVHITRIEDYDIAARHPDEVYIQDPYDGFNTTIAVPDFFHSDNLRKLTDRLVYIPCYDVRDPQSEDDKIISALRILAEQPAVYNADKIILKTDKLKKTYIDILVSFTGDVSKEYWEDKIEVSSRDERLEEELRGSKKADRKAKNLPDAWKKAIDRADKPRKLLLYQINISFLFEHGKAAIDKIQDSIDIIKGNSDDIACIFSPHETLDDIKSSGLESYVVNAYEEITGRIKSEPDFIYDEDHTANKAYEYVDAYYGNPGVLAHRCRESKIPVMIMSCGDGL